MAIAGAEGRGVRPYLTAGTLVVLAVCFMVQLWWPQLLSAVQRDAVAIGNGEIYRLLTAQLFQDGGPVGATFNLVMLAVIGVNAERVLPRIELIEVYLLGGLLSELVALSWQPVGAGNSVCYMSLAGALLTVPFLKRVEVRLRLVSLVGLLAGLVLCVLRDIHGAAVLIGVGLALVFSRLAPPARLR